LRAVTSPPFSRHDLLANAMHSFDDWVGAGDAPFRGNRVASRAMIAGLISVAMTDEDRQNVESLLSSVGMKPSWKRRRPANTAGPGRRAE
jgi:hypothetical protein